MTLVEAIIRDVASKRAPKTLEYFDSADGKALLEKFRGGLFARMFASPQKRLLSEIWQRIRGQPGVTDALEQVAENVKGDLGNAIAIHGNHPELWETNCILVIRAMVRSSANKLMAQRLAKIGGIEDAFNGLPVDFKVAFYADVSSKFEEGLFNEALRDRPQMVGSIWILGAGNNNKATWGDAGTGYYYWARREVDSSEYKQSRRAIEAKLGKMKEVERKSWAQKQLGYPWH
jgi:hypothetical protein